MAESRFVLREFERCEDCDIRGDLDAAGRPMTGGGNDLHAARIADCAACVALTASKKPRGQGFVPALKRGDPYDGVDEADPYVRRRRERAHALAELERATRRSYFQTLRIESLMSQENIVTDVAVDTRETRHEWI